MKKILVGLVILFCVQYVHPAASASSAKVSSVVTGQRFALAAIGAAVGFGVNIVSDKYVQPNVSGLAVVVPVYAAMKAIGNAKAGQVLAGYAVGATAAKSVWWVINCIKHKIRIVWNS